MNDSKLSQIPVKVESGLKYDTGKGFKAIKDGVKSNANHEVTARLKKPEWLKLRLEHSPAFDRVKSLVDEHALSTVCEEAKCPNMSECWSHGTATIMIMGDVCTRACRFCSVDTGNPQGWLDPMEPEKSAKTVQTMDLEYVVITSVDRDDLPDGGAGHYAKTIECIKAASPKTKIEALTPDFQGNRQHLDILLNAPLDVFAQNVETVERLTHPVRDIRAGYHQTIELLAYAKENYPKLFTKTSLMLGLGEKPEEVQACMRDLREAKVDILTLGQYLQPTRNHLPVERYVPPAEFDEYRLIGLEMGFYEVASGPMVRSSYRADRVFKRNNLDL